MQWFSQELLDAESYHISTVHSLNFPIYTVNFNKTVHNSFNGEQSPHSLMNKNTPKIEAIASSRYSVFSNVATSQNEKSMLGRISPPGRYKSVYKGDDECRFLECWVEMAKWPWRPKSMTPIFTIPADAIQRCIFGSHLVIVAQILFKSSHWWAGQAVSCQIGYSSVIFRVNDSQFVIMVGSNNITLGIDSLKLYSK